MPRIAENLFTQYYNSAVKLAARPNGVSRPELMELGMSRIVADKVIESAGLNKTNKIGRTDFFKLPDGAQAAVIVHSGATGKKKPKGTPVTVPPAPPSPEPTDEVGEEIQSLDKQIMEVRKLIAADFGEMAKLQTRMAGHQAMLTALISRHLAE